MKKYFLCIWKENTYRNGGGEEEMKGDQEELPIEGERSIHFTLFAISLSAYPFKDLNIHTWPTEKGTIFGVSFAEISLSAIFLIGSIIF